MRWKAEDLSDCSGISAHFNVVRLISVTLLLYSATLHKKLSINISQIKFKSVNKWKHAGMLDGFRTTEEFLIQ